ncbi:hypothetical protein Anapl_09296, partial [Anas platyrhynchos]
QKTHLSLYMVILIAVLCGAVVFLVIFTIVCIRKPKEEPTYEVAFHSTADVTRLDTAAEVPVQCLKEKINLEADTSYEIVTMKDNNYDNVCKGKNPEYETLLNSMESEYEVQNF